MLLKKGNQKGHVFPPPRLGCPQSSRRKCVHREQFRSSGPSQFQNVDLTKISL